MLSNRQTANTAIYGNGGIGALAEKGSGQGGRRK